MAPKRKRRGESSKKRLCMDGENSNTKKEDEVSQLVSKLNKSQCQDLLKDACHFVPGMVIRKRNVLNESLPNPTPPPPGSGVPGWCKCFKCRDRHNLEQARLCCGYKNQLCLSESQTFREVCLQDRVVALARIGEADFLGRAQVPVRDPNRAQRHAAYRQLAYFIHGHLGRSNRKVLPSCCVWAIRDKWPDARGVYVDFIPSLIS